MGKAIHVGVCKCSCRRERAQCDGVAPVVFMCRTGLLHILSYNEIKAPLAEVAVYSSLKTSNMNKDKQIKQVLVIKVP